MSQLKKPEGLEEWIASNQGCGDELHPLRFRYVPPLGRFGPWPVMAVSTSTSVPELLSWRSGQSKAPHA
ncbi:hypothetical protein AVEN_271853-1 [Araneus ventricosus]|uniref:Uncharacterized protein n=2 Tax=Araneus ventricosus TaxID=182803 RepID=A0A4Y2X853_ARAVE|nr:hypothetical protein AVEN_271853-1 [Araneus ventricosus]